VFEIETSKNGSQYLQGYMEFTVPVTPNRVKDIIGDSACVGMANKSKLSCFYYCTKAAFTTGRFNLMWDFGIRPVIPNSGTREALQAQIQAFSNFRSLNDYLYSHKKKYLKNPHSFSQNPL